MNNENAAADLLPFRDMSGHDFRARALKKFSMRKYDCVLTGPFTLRKRAL